MSVVSAVVVIVFAFLIALCREQQSSNVTALLDAVLAAAVATDTWRQERALLWAGSIGVGLATQRAGRIGGNRRTGNKYPVEKARAAGAEARRGNGVATRPHVRARPGAAQRRIGLSQQGIGGNGSHGARPLEQRQDVGVLRAERPSGVGFPGGIATDVARADRGECVAIRTAVAIATTTGAPWRIGHARRELGWGRRADDERVRVDDWVGQDVGVAHLISNQITSALIARAGNPRAMNEHVIAKI